MLIFGKSFFKLKSSKYLFHKTKKFINENIKNYKKNWNPLNIISRDASTVGGFDLNLISSEDGYNNTLQNLNNNKFQIVFLFGQDNLKFNKKNEFIIYIGSHGDRGAEIADIILPSPAYTEQDGYYTNLEGKIQKAYKATYPPGEAKEEWEILNEISKIYKNKSLYKDREYLIDTMMNYLNINKKNNINYLNDELFSEELIIVDEIDYFYSNVVARASKTMTECKNQRSNFKKTGTEG